MWKILRLTAALLLLTGLVMVAGSIHMFVWLRGIVQDHLGDIIGTGPAVSFLAATAAFALVCLVPWKSLIFASATGRPAALMTVVFAAAVGVIVLGIMNERIPFNREGVAEGVSILDTAEGRRIVPIPPGTVDRSTGLKTIPLSPDLLRAMNLKKRRKEGAESTPNRYFSENDGKPIVWFDRNTCRMHDADGFDDRGNPREAATPQKVDSCEQQWAMDERKRRHQAEAQAQRERSAQQATRRERFQEIGVYRAVGRWTKIDGFKFYLEQIVVLRQETRITFRVVQALDETRSNGNSRFEFGLTNGEGVQSPSEPIRRVQGSVHIADDGSIRLSHNGDEGRIAVAFRRDSDSGPFGITINQAIAFARPKRHITSFKDF